MESREVNETIARMQPEDTANDHVARAGLEMLVQHALESRRSLDNTGRRDREQGST